VVLPAVRSTFTLRLGLNPSDTFHVACTASGVAAESFTDMDAVFVPTFDSLPTFHSPLSA
jgi:hypothetical protein